MKRFQVGFAAIIAILAMSFTFASKSHTSIMKVDVADGCYTTVKLHYTSPANVLATLTITSFDILIFLDPIERTSSSPHVVQINSSKFPGQASFLIITQAPINTSTVIIVSGAIINKTTSCIQPFQAFCCYNVAQTFGTPLITSVSFKRVGP